MRSWSTTPHCGRRSSHGSAMNGRRPCGRCLRSLSRRRYCNETRCSHAQYATDFLISTRCITSKSSCSSATVLPRATSASWSPFIFASTVSPPVCATAGEHMALSALQQQSRTALNGLCADDLSGGKDEFGLKVVDHAREHDFVGAVLTPCLDRSVEVSMTAIEKLRADEAALSNRHMLIGGKWVDSALGGGGNQGLVRAGQRCRLRSGS